MQIYSKSTTNATSPLFTKINAIPQICTSGGEVYYASRNLLIHLFMNETKFSNPATLNVEELVWQWYPNE